ncbi:EAL domain-containing protein [Dialister sp.]|uniref:EAL domain-containing protein n=1 Tax=Dialister sp. TaxID=1955814 RepID=UPI003EFDB3B6
MDQSKGVLQYLDDFPGGVCLVSRDREERILAVNDELLRIFGCDSEEDFLHFTGGHFRGLMAAADYHSVAEMYGGEERNANYNFYGFPSFDRDGHFQRIEGIIGTAEDAKLGPMWVLGLVKSDARHRALERDLDTGLLGRYGFYQEAVRIRKEDEAAGMFGCRANVYITLVHFSTFNASYGMESGSRLLKKIGGILRSYFPDAVIGHPAMDDFCILAPRDHVLEKLEKALKDVNGLIGDAYVQCKAGVVLFDDDHVSFEMLQKLDWQGPLDMGRLAAESIRNDSGRSWAFYTPDMGQKVVDTTFVIRNFERALEEGAIKVYYQPVIRALTGKLCGMEALARWKDPEKGMIYPGVFIPILEKMKLIHHLDCYVIEETARLYRRLKEEHRPIIPVSVNLSRVDFDVMKPFDFLERIVSMYQVPRSFFRIEVTESALTLDRSLLKKELIRFKQAGYQLWLDDFGSGYSTLNVLQEFPFDELKIDMAFLRNFNEESRKIIRSIILMAKTLSIHTLAEGAETKEQVEFLKESGCERIQGYFYGRPMPFADMAALISKGTYVPETRQEAMVMNRVGLVNVLTDKPIGLFLDTKDKLVVLLKNEAMLRETATLNQGDHIFFEGDVLPHTHAVYPWFLALIEGSRKSGKIQTANAVRNGCMLKCEALVAAGSQTLCGGTLSIYNMSVQGKNTPVEKLNTLYRQMMRIFDSIYEVNDKEQEVEVILTPLPILKPGSTLTKKQWKQLITYVHPEDRKEFAAFINTDSIRKNAETSSRQAASAHFRIKNGSGQYEWKEVVALVLGEPAEGRVLIGIKQTNLTPLTMGEREKIMTRYASPWGMTWQDESKLTAEALFANTLRKKSDFKFFWKDKNRRFLGASQAFLDYYGFPDESSILGKTDEDMGWHLGDNTYKKEEEKVLQEGKTSCYVRGKCIIRGRLHTIRAAKVPVYKGNEIIGLLGWFVDMDEEARLKGKDDARRFIDEESGFLSYRGITISAEHYADALRTSGADYEGILLEIPVIEDFGRDYGDRSRRKLVQAIGRTIRRAFGGTAVIGRVGVNSFLIIQNAEDKETVRRKLKQLSTAIGTIRSIDGCPCTLFVKGAWAYGSEIKDIDDMRAILLGRLARC